MPFLIKSLDVSAENVYTQWTVNDTTSFFGTSFPANVTIGGVEYSTTFNYINVASYENYIDGINISANDVINSNSLSSYNLCVYKGTVSALSGDNVRGDIYIPVDIYHSGGFRFFVGAPSNLSSSSSLDPSFVGNAIDTNPANLIGLSRAPAAASSSDYYNLAHTRIRDTVWGGLTFQSRLLTYNEVDSSIAFIEFENICSLGRDFFVFIATPYSYDDVSHDSPVTTTVSTSATVPPSSSIDINVSVYVDNSQIESQLDEYLGADDTRITTYETINLGTFPTFDYNNATETVNISQVVSETGDGINSIWYLISGLFSSVPLLVWLVPFCIFMSIMSFVLWRKGG